MKFTIIWICLEISVLIVPSTVSKTCSKTGIGQREMEKANKALVLEYYQKAFGDHDYDAVYEYIGDPYTQHNPDIADGRDALRAKLPEWLDNEPKGKLDIRRTASDGDLVWVHQRQVLGGKVLAVMDIFRVENGKIVEHWDTIQQVP